MNILEKIKIRKLQEVAAAEQVIGENELSKTANMQRTCLSLRNSLLAPGSSGVIAEFKRKSPSKGFINELADAAGITAGYTKAGASGLSVLTDIDFFGGSITDFQQARENKIPILRKDFIVTKYQVVETKALGADVMLLIAACLTPKEVNEFATLAKELGLEVLLELHEEEELDHICSSIDMIGINNRNLKTFEVDIDRALRLSKQLPVDSVKIAESGISEVETVKMFQAAGYSGFLMGEQFMKQADPAKACADFISSMKNFTQL